MMPNYVILMREEPGHWDTLGEAEQARLMGLYGEFAQSLEAQGAMRGGAAFGEGRMLCAGENGIEERSFSSTEHLTGYFLIEAADLDAAVALAHACPALLHGDTVEVRRA